MDSNRPLPAKAAAPVSGIDIDFPPVITATPMAEPPLVADPKLRVVVFLMLLTAMFMATLDNQIVSTALPTIVAEFGQLERFGWVGSAYLLATSAVMPLYGKLGDLFGRKYVMIAAVSIFTLGSLVCGLAVSMNTLIAARVLQALGGGGIMVSIFSINADLFEPRERAKYQSYSSLVIMASVPPGRSSAARSAISSAGARSSSSTCRSALPSSSVSPSCSRTASRSASRRSTMPAPCFWPVRLRASCSGPIAA